MTTTRRAFLETSAGPLAGIAFVDCDLLAAAPARAQAPRREVVVNGHLLRAIGLDQMAGLSLFMLKAVLAGRGDEVIDLAKANLFH